MALTSGQLTTLKADILANTDPAVIQALADGNDGAVAEWYNLDAAPDYWIFRDLVPSDEVRDAIDAQNIADMTSADRDRTVLLLGIRSDRGFSGANTRDRSAWDDIFSTAAGDESQQAILALWSRAASNTEKVFVLGTNTGATSALADTTSFQGDITFRDVRDALNS